MRWNGILHLHWSFGPRPMRTALWMARSDGSTSQWNRGPRSVLAAAEPCRSAFGCETGLAAWWFCRQRPGHRQIRPPDVTEAPWRPGVARASRASDLVVLPSTAVAPRPTTLATRPGLHALLALRVCEDGRMVEARTGVRSSAWRAGRAGRSRRWPRPSSPAAQP